jgi:hypothetical protein
VCEGCNALRYVTKSGLAGVSAVLEEYFISNTVAERAPSSICTGLDWHYGTDGWLTPLARRRRERCFTFTTAFFGGCERAINGWMALALRERAMMEGRKEGDLYD